jgi:phospholipase/carboxylesterase
MSLQSIAIAPETQQSPVGLVVMLHGWGDTAENLSMIAPALGLPDYQIVFVNAPFPHPYTPEGRAWYDLEQDDHAGLEQSYRQLHEWLDAQEQVTGIPAERTILSGFSQGGAMTLDVGLERSLAGLVVLSGYLHRKLDQPLPQSPPVLMMHGRQDRVVPLQMAWQARDAMQNKAVTVDYREFDLAHEVSLAELTVMRDFVRDRVPSR